MAPLHRALLALAALALGALLSGCTPVVYETRPPLTDPNVDPNEHSGLPNPPTVGRPSSFLPSGKGMQDSAGNGLH